MEIGQERGRGAEVRGNRHSRERQQSEHRNEKLCGTNVGDLGWLNGAHMYEREQRKIKLGKIGRG